MPGEVLAGRLPASSDLLGRMIDAFTPEQVAAIECDRSPALLDASAGSGKTAVLVERFVRAVVQGGADVHSILAITFTEKAASGMRERIRAALRAQGAEQAARAAEEAQISTIHAFCARLLRAGALELGIDPAFTVLDEHLAARLSADAFDAALEQIAGGANGARLIAAHGPSALRGAVLACYGKLRSLGQARPALPPLTGDGDAACDDLARAVAGLHDAAQAAATELGELADPSVRVLQALGTLARARELRGAGEYPWPADLPHLSLPAHGGTAALATGACDAYRAALASLRTRCERAHALPARAALDELLGAFGERYEALKRERSTLDFEDLELLALELVSRPGVAARLRERLRYVMVDELQDTNRVQFALIDLVAAGNLFMVGDAQQSIYGFRHAEVELFEARGRELGTSGSRLALTTNFRSRPEIIAVLNAAFGALLGDGFRQLVPGRPEPAGDEPLVELLVVDKGVDWEGDGLGAPWRQAEARALAARVRELMDSGTPPGEVVVLTRAATDLRVYERALEGAGVPTYTIGGRGYWSHPQVVELVCYLRALANPLDQEALYGTWCSQLCGLSLDGLVVLAADAREQLSAADLERIETFERWFEAERSLSAVLGPEELLSRAVQRSGYLTSVLAKPGGHRRVANVRKLMRFAREWELTSGSELHGLLEMIAERAQLADRESEAPVDSEAMDAVRLMTIHRAKGLEFGVVCVADLGRGPVWRPELIRLARDGAHVALKLGRPGTAARVPALDYDELGENRAREAQREELRLFYVAMTRARERLLLSGAARLDAWSKGNRGTPIDWLAPALVPDIATDQTSRTTALGIRVTFLQDDPDGRAPAERQLDRPGSGETEPASEPPSRPASEPTPVGEALRAPLATVSYSSLERYRRCGYRFYVERVLGIPSASDAGAAAQRGTTVHALLERLDFRRPRAPAADGLPDPDAGVIGEMIERFAASATCMRLSRAQEVRREQPFVLSLDGGDGGARAGGDGGGVRETLPLLGVQETLPLLGVQETLPLLTGAFDVLAREVGGRLVVVDYKTDRLGGADPEQLVAERYELQRRIYALAALRTGAEEVEVLHLFLDHPEAPAARVFAAANEAALERELRELVRAIARREFPVAEAPCAALCAGCPAEAGLCSWPPDLTRRAAAAPAAPAALR